MTYDAQSSLTGDGVASAAQITAWFRARNANAPDFGPVIVAQCAAGQLNSDIVSAQICHETGWWTSYAATQLFNPAGLGITNDLPRDQWPGFPTIEAGIHAQCAHLLTYTQGDANPWQADDPRFAATRGSDMFGKARVLQDLEQHWAWSKPEDYAATPPNQRYAARIAALANDLTQFAQQNGDTMSGRDPQATWLPSSNYNQGRNGKAIEMIVEHITQGTDSRSWLRGAAGGSTNRDSSSTYLVQRAAELWQLVDEGDTPWADGNLDWNQRSITIEHEGYSGEPLTAPQIQASAELHARIAQRRGWTQLVRGQNVYGHADVPDPNNPSQGGGIDHHVNCPGPAFPWDDILGGANAILQGGQPSQPDDPCRYFPETQHRLCLGFKAFWTKFGGLPIFGYPISEEFQIDGMTVQYFEKGARFEWQPGSGGNPPNDWDVMMGNTGSENLDELKAKYPDAFAPVQS